MEHTTPKIVIAIDGFSSCGKSTMAKDLARKIGYIYIDSGAMYRAVTLFCLNRGLIDGDTVDTEALRPLMTEIHIEFRLNPATGKADTYLNGENVEQEIRSMRVSDKVSPVSAIPFVRTALVALQQEMGRQKGIVMDGRDIGTTVFPDAELKIFVTASAATRAQRRVDELRAKGVPVDFDEVVANIVKRDHIDQTRKESPLRKADDAIELDNSTLTIEQQNQWLEERFHEALLRKA
jgi:cytidylate kinase